MDPGAAEQPPHYIGHEQQRNQYRDQRQRQRDQGETDLLGALEREAPLARSEWTTLAERADVTVGSSSSARREARSWCWCRVSTMTRSELAPRRHAELVLPMAEPGRERGQHAAAQEASGALSHKVFNACTHCGSSLRHGTSTNSSPLTLSLNVNNITQYGTDYSAGSIIQNGFEALQAPVQLP